MKNWFTNNFISEIKAETREGVFSEAWKGQVFKEWCEVNGNIKISFVPRNKWQNDIEILQKQEEGYFLNIPRDIKLHEIMDVIKEMDEDTFKNSGNPEEQHVRIKKLTEMGELFEKSGLYLFKYLPFLEKKVLAGELAKEFYDYGLSLQKKEKSEELLTKEDIDQIDKWFLGEEVYAKRIERLGENCSEEDKDVLRKHLLDVYFKALEREESFCLRFNSFKEMGEYFLKKEQELEEVSRSVGSFQYKAKEKIKNVIKTPENELFFAVLEKGVKKLISKVNTYDHESILMEFLEEGLGMEIALEKIKIYNYLNLEEQKMIIEEARKRGDMEEIVQMEIDIAKMVHEEVNLLTYQRKNCFVNDIIETNRINCLGASLLGSSLLKEVGINCLHVSIYEHSCTVLITSDGSMYWQDFLCPKGRREWFLKIEDFMLENGVKVSKIIEECKKDGITVFLKDRFNFVEEMDLGICISNISKGVLAGLLYSLGCDFLEKSYIKESEIIFKKAVEISPNDKSYFEGRAFSLFYQSRYREVEEIYKKILKISPNLPLSCDCFGIALIENGKDQEAEKFFRRAIEKYPEKLHNFYWLGQCLFTRGEYSEAGMFLKEFLLRASGNEKYEYLIQRANKYSRLMPKE